MYHCYTIGLFCSYFRGDIDMEATPSTSTASSKGSNWKKRQVHYYMMPAVFVTLFCFWPTGIMAIMKVTDTTTTNTVSNG
ncbi:hypothetical protein KP79_PYT17995 [Mizuhopecten yessoensis]|uniref:Uncharacterized protein n=1 Tax=Mizuhopecten yessoensis TaxID=6573 RepID=A0A210R1P4_MIZYE|nr:hypothetical protein KP79_PYT17995 [Mizuhopecten yessoensis]